jgi:phospholipid/cholesterol/gamma-HCH transport system permease protein
MAGQQQAYTRIDGPCLFIGGPLTKEHVPRLFAGLRKTDLPAQLRRIDLSGVTRLDTSGIALLEWLRERGARDTAGPARDGRSTEDAAGPSPGGGVQPGEGGSETGPSPGGLLEIDASGAPEEAAKLLGEFLGEGGKRAPSEERRGSPLEQMGEGVVGGIGGAGRLAVLTAEIFYWSVIGVFSRAQRRAMSVMEQCWIIGVQSLPLIALLSAILGVILSLQSALQLRTFGANIYVADLMAISMVTEMGPMMSAILVAGRSGSAIASEIATMKVSEEIEALEVMGITPIRYVVVPKFLAITLTIPLLVGFSIYLGIGGGILVGMTTLEIAPAIFISRSADAVAISDIVRSLTKSVFFGWVIVVISSHFGFSVSGGAEEVGNATTQAVVYSIISVIILDALFSLTSLI